MKKANHHNLKAMFWVLLTALVGGSAGAMAISDKAREGMMATPLQALCYEIVSLSAVILGWRKSLTHRLLDGQMQIGAAGLALESEKSVPIGGMTLSEDSDGELLKLAGQSARKEIFAVVREKRAASQKQDA